MKVLLTVYGDENLKGVEAPEEIARTMEACGEFDQAARAAEVFATRWRRAAQRSAPIELRRDDLRWLASDQGEFRVRPTEVDPPRRRPRGHAGIA
jgi:hypothetical protein